MTFIALRQPESRSKVADGVFQIGLRGGIAAWPVPSESRM